MIDLEYFRDLLQTIADRKYQGIETGSLIDEILGPNLTVDDTLKFKYHMDEIWDAGLVKNRDGANSLRWGYETHRPRLMYTSVPLVLTPIGSDALAEMKKPRGLERLKTAVLSVGGSAGTEAVKMGVGELLRSSIT